MKLQSNKEMKRYYVTSGFCGNVFDVSTDETDLSQTVRCLDNDTGNYIDINGWSAEWEEWEELETL